ncbi:protein-tyrosine sulfotransferase-like isoform X2 [Magnolia sinica]|uniref:protein-tyrosine sulfotransferase-like isoform X2 n=1 Tax=Magnolia sinica TaxID=86752 RepID=UPI00265A5C65|nr:protein-tyrosine sulfotransferase-like isoform X2 [Magnolia sinica]
MGRQKMAYACKFSMLLMLVAVASALTIESSTKDDLLQCESIVKNWAASSLIDGVQGDKLKLRDLLFFLHVPRTGGRTYFQCFLRKLYTSDLECPRSYDKLRFDPSQPNCRLMATHDDYSIMSKLPKESTSVVTILRNPVDRVFSTYEFSVEVAARFLIHPNLTSATQITGRLRPKARGVSTLDIWPWKYLVPWMREDLFGRREARKLGKVMGIRKRSYSYDMEDIVIPLPAFVNDPLAHEIIHNGATFQVAGLTNNSCLAESHKVRHCVRKHPVLGQHVLDVAKKRLDNMLYVGLTEEHKESAAMFANVVGVQVLSLLEALNSRTNQAVNNRTESEHDSSNQLRDSIDGQKLRETPSVKKIETADENTTVVKLMEAYEACISSLRKSQASRRVSSLKRISPANFSKEARLQVPETLLQQILLLNSLDVELYKHAQNIFAQQRKHFMQKLDTVEIQESMPSNSSGHYAQKAFWLAVTTVFVVLIIVLFVTSRRRTSKLKV